MTEPFSDLGVTVPQSMKDLILLASKVQNIPVTVIVRMALKREEAFLMSLAYLEETSIPQEDRRNGQAADDEAVAA